MNVVISLLVAFFASVALAENEAPHTGSSLPKTFRPIDTTRQMEGGFVLKETIIQGKTGHLPYFKDYKSGKLYEISDKCDDGSEAGRACLKAINECKANEYCRITAEFT